MFPIFPGVQAREANSQQLSVDGAVSILIGVGLAAACGLRVFLPILAMSIATHVGIIEPGPAMAWLGTWTALLALTTATIAEIVAYYVPWVDNALDTLATPLAALAGAVAAAAVMLPPDAVAPGWQWAGALLAGGASAGAVQVGTVAARTASTVSTGGVGNHVVATAENAGAATISLMFLVAPVVGAVMVLGAGYLGYRWFVRRPRVAFGPGYAAPVPARRRFWVFSLLGWMFRRKAKAPA